jgi:hypothetical protein
MENTWVIEIELVVHLTIPHNQKSSLNKIAKYIVSLLNKLFLRFIVL